MEPDDQTPKPSTPSPDAESTTAGVQASSIDSTQFSPVNEAFAPDPSALASTSGHATPTADSSESSLTTQTVTTQSPPLDIFSATISPEPATPSATAGTVIAPGASQTSTLPTAPQASSILSQPDWPPDQGTKVKSNRGLSFGSSGSRKKKLFVFGAGLIVLLLGTTAFVFGYYLPNRPQNIYKTGLNRTGQAFNQLVTQATQTQTLDAFKKSDITITVDAKQGKTAYSAKFNAKFDPSKVDSSLDVTAKQTGFPDKILSAKLKGELAKGSSYPFLYFQLTGLKAFGLDTFYPAVNAFDGKWITIDESYFKSLGISSLSLEQSQQKQFTTQDSAELARAATSAAADYLLTANPTKAVFDQKKFIAKESVDGLSTYHYQVGIDKPHANDFCAALADKITSTNAFKKFPGVDANKLDDEKKSMVTSCQDGVKNIKDSDTFDMWVDAKYKLIYKVRLPDSSNSDAYSEVGQNYKGGDDISMFVNFHDGKAKTDGKLSVNTNLKTYITSGTFVFSGASVDSPFDLTATIQAKPLAGDLVIDKPTGAIPIQDVLKSLGVRSSPIGVGRGTDSPQ